MNILIVNHYSGSPEHGMEHRHFYLSEEWLKLGHNPCIVAASYSHLRSKQPHIKGILGQEIINGIPHIWIRTPKYKNNGALRALNILVFSLLLFILQKRILRIFQPDVIIASTPHPLAIFGAERLARSVNAKLLFEVRDLWPLTLTELGGMSRRHPFIRIMQYAEIFAYQVSDLVITLLPRIDDYLAQAGIQAKTCYIPNGIKSEEWTTLNDINNSGLIDDLIQLKKEGKLIVGYTGAHGLANQLNLLIDTASLMRGHQVAFVLIGHGPVKNRLRAIAAQKRLENVHFFDPVPKKDIPKILAHMDMLFISLQNRDFFLFGISPNKLMDYLMSAKPVINAIKAGNDPVAESNCGISIPEGDPETIKNAIVKIMQMPDLERKSMGMRGRDFISKNHDYSVLASRYINAIEGTSATCSVSDR